MFSTHSKLGLEQLEGRNLLSVSPSVLTVYTPGVPFAAYDSEMRSLVTHYFLFAQPWVGGGNFLGSVAGPTLPDKNSAAAYIALMYANIPTSEIVEILVPQSFPLGGNTIGYNSAVWVNNHWVNYAVCAIYPGNEAQNQYVISHELIESVFGGVLDTFLGRYIADDESSFSLDNFTVAQFVLPTGQNAYNPQLQDTTALFFIDFDLVLYSGLSVFLPQYKGVAYSYAQQLANDPYTYTSVGYTTWLFLEEEIFTLPDN